MITVILHGHLSELHKEPIKVKVQTAMEALSALQLLPAFNPRLVNKKYICKIDGFDSKDSLSEKLKDGTELHLRPLLAGAGGGGRYLQVIVGVVLVVIGVAVNYFSGGSASAIGNALIVAGIANIAGGLIQLLMAQKQPSSDDPSERSKYLAANKNTVAIGTRIPLILGRAKAYGHYLSFDVDSRDITDVPNAWYCRNSPISGAQIPNPFCAAPQQGDPNPGDVLQSYLFTGITYENNKPKYLNFDPSAMLRLGQVKITCNTEGKIRVIYGQVLADGLTSRIRIAQEEAYEDLIPGTTTALIEAMKYTNYPTYNPNPGEILP